MTTLTTERRDGRVFALAAFLAAVQDTGTLATAGEADRAVKATLGELGGCLSWGTAEGLADRLPKPLRQLVRSRSFDGSMSRFAPHVFLRRIADEVGTTQAARDTRAVLRTLDLMLPRTLTEQLHAELASLWGPLTAGAGSSAVAREKGGGPPGMPPRLI